MEKLALSQDMAIKAFGGRHGQLPAIEFEHVHEGTTYIGFLYSKKMLEALRAGIDEAIGGDQISELQKKVDSLLKMLGAEQAQVKKLQEKIKELSEVNNK